MSTPRNAICDWCGKQAFCNSYQSTSREIETGYVDSMVLCSECSREFEEQLDAKREQRARARGIRGRDDDT